MRFTFTGYNQVFFLTSILSSLTLIPNICIICYCLYSQGYVMSLTYNKDKCKACESQISYRIISVIYDRILCIQTYRSGTKLGSEAELLRFEMPGMGLINKRIKRGQSRQNCIWRLACRKNKLCQEPIVDVTRIINQGSLKCCMFLRN